MTRKEIRDLTRKLLGETTASFWTDTELNTWINDAGTDIAYLTKCLKDNGYITTVEDTNEYTISSNFSTLLSISKVYLYQDGSSWQNLKSTTRDKLDREHPGWLSADSGTPTKYYYDIQEDTLGLYVPPDSDNAGSNYLRVYYAKEYTDVTDDDSTPDLPEFLHLAMCYYVTSLGFAQRGYGDKSNDMRNKYASRIKGYRSESKREKVDEDIIMIPQQNL